MDSFPADSTSIFARRAARIAASAVLLVGIVLVVAAAGDTVEPYRDTAHPRALPVLGITWATAALVASLVHGLVRLLRPAWRPAQLLMVSLILPAVACALLLPLTLHAIVFAVCGALSDFDDWVVTGMIITGLAHLVFAALSALRVHRLLVGRPAITAKQIFGWTTAAAAVPSLLFLGLPLTIIALTGLPLVPVFGWLGRVVERERDELAAMPGQLPRAALVVRQ